MGLRTLYIAFNSILAKETISRGLKDNLFGGRTLDYELHALSYVFFDVSSSVSAYE